MSSWGRSVSSLWVLMLLLLSAKNGMTVVKVTNCLDLDLTIYCSNLGPMLHLIHPGSFYELNNSSGSTYGKSPFFCFFQWEDAFNNFDMCVPSEGGGCKQCNWFISQHGPCRYEGANRICGRWN
ncbi:hypothetical protein VNO80_07706 [Phaseolus coccineus]|uniref:S-protein homolog n=1 Tax=Phaseolus coccineus TaxID=3886 RepID=A0AAN9NP66_PHACN